MSSTKALLRKAATLFISIWLVGALLTFGYELINRKIQCIKENGFFSGLTWCELEFHQAMDSTGISSFITLNSVYFKLVYKSVTWPNRIINKNNHGKVEEFVIPKVNKKELTHQCIKQYGPKMKRNVPLTMDDSVLLIPVQSMCAVAYEFDHPPSSKAARCVLDKLYLGVRAKEYVNLVEDCLTGYNNSTVSNLFGYSICMMVMMEDGKITDQKSALSSQEDCLDKIRKTQQMQMQSR